jgi:ribosomal protein L31E
LEIYVVRENKSTDEIAQLHGVTFKKRAPRAIKEIKAFATKSMVGTTRFEARSRICRRIEN